MTQTELAWKEDALELFKRVPPFIRPTAKIMIEEYARDVGVTEVTAEVIAAARAKFGM
jgi:hypothetical protein